MFKMRSIWTLTLGLPTAAIITIGNIKHQLHHMNIETYADHFRMTAQNHIKITLNTLQVQMYSIYVLRVAPSPECQSISLYDQPFLAYMTF